MIARPLPQTGRGICPNRPPSTRAKRPRLDTKNTLGYSQTLSFSVSGLNSPVEREAIAELEDLFASAVRLCGIGWPVVLDSSIHPNTREEGAGEARK